MESDNKPNSQIGNYFEIQSNTLHPIACTKCRSRHKKKGLVCYYNDPKHVKRKERQSSIMLELKQDSYLLAPQYQETCLSTSYDLKRDNDHPTIIMSLGNGRKNSTLTQPTQQEMTSHSEYSVFKFRWKDNSPTPFSGDGISKKLPLKKQRQQPEFDSTLYKFGTSSTDQQRNSNAGSNGAEDKLESLDGPFCQIRSDSNSSEEFKPPSKTPRTRISLADILN